MIHSLTEDLNKTVEFNPFSDKSKKLITSMGMSIPGHVIKKDSYPWSQKWTIYAAVHVLQSTWHAEESPQTPKWFQERSGQMEKLQIPQIFVR